MWGGTPDRNIVSNMKGLPTSWDVKTKKNVKWVAELGSQAYGNPVVANGIVLVGTNNEAMQDPTIKGDKGVLMAFRESDGQFLWQAVHDKLAAGRANDWPFQGVCSSPLVENGIATTSRIAAKSMAVDTRGLPRQGRTTARSRTRSRQRETDVDIIWRYDMMEELGVLQHNMANSSPVVLREPDLRQHVERPGREPRQRALAEIAGDHRARQEDRQAGVGRQLGRREDPARAVVVAGRRQDRRHRAGRRSARATAGLRGYEAKTGKKLWEFDLNPKDSVWPKTRNEVISTPVIYENVVYIANGQDPEHGEGVGHLYAIDADQDAATSPRRVDLALRQDPALDLDRAPSTTASCSTPTSAASCTRSTSRPASRSGPTTCSPRSGDRRWSSTARSISATKTATSRSCNADRTMKVIAENNMGSSVYSTPVPANGALFIVNRNELFALAEANVRSAK